MRPSRRKLAYKSDDNFLSYTLYTQKLALTSPTIGSRSVGIIRSRTPATEYSI
jgi:hypothetical protein